MSGFVAAVLEAWAELRIHRTRVLLALIGVAVAVAALTSVMGISGIAQQSMVEQYERQGGRPATVTVDAYPVQGELDPAAFDEAMRTSLERYEITHATRVGYGSTSAQFADGARSVQIEAVDAAYGTMHRVSLVDGRWFTERDAARLAPAIIVNERMHEQLGSPALATHPTVTLLGEQPVTAVVIGISPASPWETEPRMYMLPDQVPAQRAPSDQFGGAPNPQWRLWVPPELAPDFEQVIARDVRGALGNQVEVNTYRSDYLAWGSGDPLAAFTMTVGAIAVLVLALGVLGLVNITLVTVRYRIREIGIRRSFGATARRVFFTVMMESVVATIVAGVIGVMIAVAVVSNPWLQSLVLGGSGIQDLPAFPMDAALLGLVTAAAAGAIAGLLPALVAVRVKVIDAIRY